MSNQYRRGEEPECPYRLPGCKGIIRTKGCSSCHPCAHRLRRGQAVGPVAVEPVVVATELSQALLAALRKQPATVVELARVVGGSPGQVLDAILALQAGGANLHQLGDRWSLEKRPAVSARTFDYVSRPDNTFYFGVSSDQHLGSKYERLDVLNDLYDWFAAEGVDRVINCGNWIEGEDEKNKHDIAVYGLEPQVDYLIAHYPRRDGLETFAVWGEDHEGWFARRESIDIGRFTERKMREAGRTDWHDLGFMESSITLTNANTGAKTFMLAMHPGGGTAYALSYRPQKLVESLQGGEKPACILIGHYHKISKNLIRGVWALQVGCSQDQTPFMRKIPTEPHVGGLILKLTQDPQTGAITGCRDDARQYFNKSYYNDRWSKSGPAVLPDRSLVIG